MPARKAQEAPSSPLGPFACALLRPSSTGKIADRRTLRYATQATRHAGLRSSRGSDACVGVRRPWSTILAQFYWTFQQVLQARSLAFGMAFAGAPYDAHTLSLMAAALETAWMAARLGVPQLSEEDRAIMEAAIINAVACGERDFSQLQQAAFDAVGATAVKPVDRRKHLRLVGTDRRRR